MTTSTGRLGGGWHACAGAVDRYLGMLEATLRLWTVSEVHFERALALEKGAESAPLVARTRYWYGAMLLQRDSVGDRARARDQLEAASRSASDLGMQLLAAQAAAQLAVLDP